MYKVINRNGSVFGTEPCSCEFVCDITDDVSTLPTSIAKGTGGKTKYDNQVCGSGSIAVVVDNGANPKRYILDNQDVWCPQSLDGTGSNQDLSEYAKKTDLDSKADATHTHSASDVGADARGSAAEALSEAKTYTDNAVANLINGAPTTRDTLKEISDLMDENSSVVEALDAAIANKSEIKSIEMFGTTDPYGNLFIWNVTDRRRPIFATFNDFYAIPFLTANGDYYVGLINCSTHEYITGTPVSGTIYYIEI